MISTVNIAFVKALFPCTLIVSDWDYLSGVNCYQQEWEGVWHIGRSPVRLSRQSCMRPGFEPHWFCVGFEDKHPCFKLMILYLLEVEIGPKLYFHGGHFEKWPKPISRPNCFSDNIANTVIIPRRALNKMVPLMEGSDGGGGGVLGDQFCPRTIIVMSLKDLSVGQMLGDVRSDVHCPNLNKKKVKVVEL